MVFAKQLRDGIKRGRITISIRVWMHPRVKAGGRYAMDDGHIVVDSIEEIRRKDITHDLARESGFASVGDLMTIARHGKGEKIYLVRFHYLRPGAWDTPAAHSSSGSARVRATRRPSASPRRDS
jgi:hypothetical protein